jgi:release factor glutamine methyltransferase
MKSLLEVLTTGAAYLQKHGVDEARLNMEHLLAHVLGCRRLDLYLRFEEKLHEDTLVPMRDLLKRRGEGVPLQHLLGTVDFLGHELVSDHRALIPRPETEHLVDWLIREVKAGRMPKPASVLDMATGSGCIGLALAAAWKEARVQLADISEDALDLARLNASRLGLEAVHLVRSDLFEKVPGRFDFIISNLPYIPTAEVATGWRAGWPGYRASLFRRGAQASDAGWWHRAGSRG